MIADATRPIIIRDNVQYTAEPFKYPLVKYLLVTP